MDSGKARFLRCLSIVLTLSFVLLGVLQFGTVYAAGEVDFVNFTFSSSKVYQGDSQLYVDLVIVNNGNLSVRLHGASVRFDWQAANESFMVGVSKGGEPFDLRKVVLPDADYTFRIFFDVPITTKVGYHFFEFRVFYDYQINATDWALDQNETWFPNIPWAVSDLYEKSYNILGTTVADKIAKAEAAGFISPEARSLLQTAITADNDAADYAAQGQWQIAVGKLQYANAVLDQTYGAEQAFRTYLIVGAIVGVAAIVGAVLFLRRRRRSKKETTAKTTG